MDLFEKASRTKLRFSTPSGNINVEDLWSLPLTSARGLSLDSLAIGVNEELEKTSTKSFVTKSANPLRDELQLKLDILKRIIEVRQTEKDERLEKEKKNSRAAQIREALEAKKSSELMGMTTAELEAELAKLS